MNYFAIIIAAIFNMVWGFLWYGPLLGKQWMRENGFTKQSTKNKGMGWAYTLMFIAALVMAYGMNWLINISSATDWVSGVIIGVLAWLVFSVTTKFGSWLFSQRKLGAFLIDVGYYLVSFVVFGALFAVWR